MIEHPIGIECLTDETFPLGYERVTFRRTSPKYLAVKQGQWVRLRSRCAEATAEVVSRTLVYLHGIADFPLAADAPYRNGAEVIAQLERVYPDAKISEPFVCLSLRVVGTTAVGEGEG